MDGLIWFWYGRFFRPVLYCDVRKLSYLQNNGTSLLNFFLNSGLKKLRHGVSIVETCCRLSSSKADAQSVINWTVDVPPSSDSQPL